MFWIQGAAVVIVTLLLLGADLSYKLGTHNRWPTDTAADISLAALTANVIHMLRPLLAQSPYNGSLLPIGGAFLVVVVQFVLWFRAVLWGAQMEQAIQKNRKGGHTATVAPSRLFKSYFWASAWAALSMSMVMVWLVPQ